MSIAETEADSKSNAIDHFSYGNPEDAYWDGYVAGRTALVTDAEIEAVIAASRQHREIPRYAEDALGESNPQPCSCGFVFESKTERLRHIALAQLSAARKQVTQ